MSPQPRQAQASGERKYEALRGGNYREGGEEAEVGQVYSDIPAHLVEDLVARRAIADVTGIATEKEGEGNA